MKGDRGAPRGERNKQKDEGGEERRKRLGDFFSAESAKKGVDDERPFLLIRLYDGATHTYLRVAEETFFGGYCRLPLQIAEEEEGERRGSSLQIRKRREKRESLSLLFFRRR